MKKNLLNLTWIVTAFILGISIHSACSKSDSNSDFRSDSNSDLRAEIQAIKGELAALKAQVSSISNNGGDVGSEFKVGDLYFDRDGYVSSKPIQCFNDNYTSSFIYDSEGRISKIIDAYDGHTQIHEYTYSEKNVTYTFKMEYDPVVYPSQSNYESTTVTEYY